jgi:hypothetical protein
LCSEYAKPQLRNTDGPISTFAHIQPDWCGAQVREYQFEPGDHLQFALLFTRLYNSMPQMPFQRF